MERSIWACTCLRCTRVVEEERAVKIVLGELGFALFTLGCGGKANAVCERLDMAIWNV